MSKSQIQFGNYIDGKWLEKGNGEFLKVVDKYSQEPITQLPMATESDVEKAITSAQKGFDEIRTWSAGKRSAHLQRLWTAVKERRTEIVDLIVKEAGKPKSYAESEASRCLSTIEHAIVEAKRMTGEMVPIDFDAGEGKTAFTKRFPIGPILCITPFNFPLNLVLHKVAPALAVGCSVIVKPAPQSPLSALFLANLLEEAGYPAGVANFLVCSNSMAEKMVRDDRLSMISFTGSEKVGWHLKSICGMKKVALELGGNAAVIVDENTDLKAIAKTVANGAFLYAGQICISTQRIFALKSIFEDFKKFLTEEIKKLLVGDPKEKDTIVGPLIDQTHFERIQEWVKEAQDAGAEVLIGGEVHKTQHHTYLPTLLTNTKSPMKVVDEEAFGPIATLEIAASFEEAIDKVNDSKFGLQVGVFTDSLQNVQMAFEKLEVGGVMINSVPGFRIDNMPYGGIKMSGLGREGVRYAMEEMTEPRLLVY